MEHESRMDTKDAGKEQQRQDPLLNPGQLKQIVKNLPGKLKLPHDDYKYGDTDRIDKELDELFDYVEIAKNVREYQHNCRCESGSAWPKMEESEKRKYVQVLLDKLDKSSREERLQAARQVVFIALGAVCKHNEYPDLDGHLQALYENNKTLRSCGAINSVLHSLKSACAKHDAHSTNIEVLNALSAEIDLYITMMYVMVESLRQERAGQENEDESMLDVSILQFLFSVVAQLRDKYVKTFPVKKLILLLWKVFLATFGGFDALKQARAAVRVMHGLDPGEKATPKCTPQDFYNFQNEILLKYPTYQSPDIPLPATSPITVNASPALVKAMGIERATSRIDLPYQTLFPPKSSSSSNNSSSSTVGRKQQQQQSLVWPSSASESFVLPLNFDGPAVPQSTSEAGNLFVQNMHVSLANYQIMSEREKAIRRWQIKKADCERSKDQPKQDLPAPCSGSMSSAFQKKFDAIEQLYAFIVPDLQNIIIVLLKLLLSTVVTNNSSNQSTENSSQSSSENGRNVDVKVLEDIDLVRNREILSKAISAVLILLLKWTKVSHVLKFEYISQILVDSGCLLLILKILGLQEITTLVGVHTDLDSCSIFEKRQLGTTRGSSTYTNSRNMFWSINFLRILQMLSKRKTHRIMLLVQYKSSAILKRILKVSHPVLELYTLKVLKSQVPYLGRKWRSLNMKIISAIYLRCLTSLRDDWVSKQDTDADMEDGMMQETNLRMLIRIYIGERYLPHFLPPLDDSFDIDLADGSDVVHGHISPSTTMMDDHSEELSPDFKENYEKWLMENVYDSMDDENEEQKPSTSDTDYSALAPSTPIPSPYIMPVDSELSESLQKLDINDLYRDALDDELSTDASSEDGPRSPISYMTDDVNNEKQELFYGLYQKLRTVEHITVQRWHEAHGQH
ncbi:hypothetical protein VTP01DRAFT_1979 [Rhizomucor pusillus]|uniref:uncharacterized protein n=1 Tax=Rhizomucor pusillus TaxID=4840 RepID=UPI003741EF36